MIDPFNPPIEFQNWIKSISLSFRDRLTYQPFEDYLKQAKEWLNDHSQISDCSTNEQKIEFIKRERKRCDVNSVYYVNKYLKIKEPNVEGGILKAMAWESQEIICYLFDLGLSLAISKARGIGGSTILLPILCKRSMCRKNYTAKFICSDGDKVEKLFEDKLKVPFYELPNWFRPQVGSNRKDGLDFFKKVGKDEIQGLNSTIGIIPPSVDAINGQNPAVVMIDEAASIPRFSAMMGEARPALFRFDETQGKRVMARQLIMWGSSQSEEGKNTSDEYENEMNGWFEGFENGNFTSGIIPLFFDWTAIRGMTQEIYDREKQDAINKKDEQALIRFKKHYPSCKEDVYLKDINTVIPYIQISQRIEEIRTEIRKGNLMPQRGYFQPIYGQEKMPDVFISPFNIIGANFIPVSDSDLHLATTTIFKHPNHKWRHRYYQGTDPINSQAGHSKWSSAIWDASEHTIDALINYRPQDYRKMHEQSVCLNLYYTRPDLKYMGIPELVEYNVAADYITYKEIMKNHRSMVNQFELPPYLRSGEHEIGIAKRSQNKDNILNELWMLLTNYKDRIWMEDLFLQLKTYTKQQNNSKTGYSFAPQDKKHQYDDVIDAITYAFICASCFKHFEPIEDKEESLINKKVTRKLQMDSNWRLTMKEIR